MNRSAARAGWKELGVDVAVQHDADLLALGTHGRSGLAHALLGSVAEAVIHAASCDVLVARLRFELP
jgi:nucleotide-binding universal stress UspA family protein